jgi:hypothetical protein
MLRRDSWLDSKIGPVGAGWCPMPTPWDGACCYEHRHSCKHRHYREATRRARLRSSVIGWLVCPGPMSRWHSWRCSGSSAAKPGTSSVGVSVIAVASLPSQSSRRSSCRWMQPDRRAVAPVRSWPKNEERPILFSGNCPQAYGAARPLALAHPVAAMSAVMGWGGSRRRSTKSHQAQSPCRERYLGTRRHLLLPGRKETQSSLPICQGGKGWALRFRAS